MENRFINFLFEQRDFLNRISDSVMLINPEEIDDQRLYFYYCEFKRRERLSEVD